MKHLYRVTAGLLAACLAALPYFHRSEAVFEAKALTAEEQALRNAEIVICGINDIRAANGLQELAARPVLIDCATVRAEDLATLFDHVRPDGSSCFSVMKQAGVTYSSSAENIAAGRNDPVSTVSQWMDSSGHRANILNPAFTHIGVGYYYDADSYYEYHWGMFLIASYEGEYPYIYDDQYFPERTLGDVNGTKTINAGDASAILKYSAEEAAGLNPGVTHDFRDAADVNGDGQVNSLDASIILIYSASRGAGKPVTLQDCIW